MRPSDPDLARIRAAVTAVQSAALLLRDDTTTEDLLARLNGLRSRIIDAAQVIRDVEDVTRKNALEGIQ